MNKKEKAFIRKFFVIENDADYDIIWGFLKPIVQKVGFSAISDWFWGLNEWFSGKVYGSDWGKVVEKVNKPEMFRLFEPTFRDSIPDVLYRGMIMKERELPPKGSVVEYGSKFQSLSGWSSRKTIAKQFVGKFDKLTTKILGKRGVLLSIRPKDIPNFEKRVVWAPPGPRSLLYFLESVYRVNLEREWILDLSNPVPVASCQGCFVSNIEEEEKSNMKTNQIEQMVDEEVDKYVVDVPDPPEADEEHAEAVVQIAEHYEDLIRLWQQGEIQLKTVAIEVSKEYYRELVQDTKEKIFNREQLAKVIVLLQQSPVFSKKR